jgi:hypothetical protein
MSVGKKETYPGCLSEKSRMKKLPTGASSCSVLKQKIGFEPEFEETGEEFQVTLPFVH